MDEDGYVPLNALKIVFMHHYATNRDTHHPENNSAFYLLFFFFVVSSRSLSRAVTVLHHGSDVWTDMANDFIDYIENLIDMTQFVNNRERPSITIGEVFHGTLKSQTSDFIVSEIDKDGKIADLKIEYESEDDGKDNNIHEKFSRF